MKDDNRPKPFESGIKKLLRNQDWLGAIQQNLLVQAQKSIRPEDFRKEIRAQLWFRGMYDRETYISEAHDKTFEWVFEGQEHSRRLHLSRADFATWLQDNRPIYWITGKPGSGKSTLMKFLTRHADTKQCLSKWASGTELVTFSFYFWNSGSNLQKSPEGLLRTFLFQALEAKPELADAIFPRRLATWAMHQSSLSFPLTPIGAFSWTKAELIEAFEKLWLGTAETSKMCLFIDGLDEFDGDPMELVELIQRVKSPNIKICISSRPW